jgi:DNA processing protein
MAQQRRPARSRYVAPNQVVETTINDFLELIGRRIPNQQGGLFGKSGEADPLLFWSGQLDLLRAASVCVIGARSVSEEGRLRARRIARELSSAGVTVVSGLAKGVDTAAHEATLAAGGSTVAVIGTPIDKCYPAENARLQETIWREHLLISQFPSGHRTFPSDFPKRNRLMAAITDGSIIVEASDTSGSLHQAVECVKLGRWLFIMKSVVDDPRLEWPAKFLREQRVVVLSDTRDVVERIHQVR